MKNGTTSSLSDMLQDLFEDEKLVAMTPAGVPLLDNFDRTDRLPASFQDRQTSVHLCSSTPLKSKSNSPWNASSRQQPNVGVVAVIQLAHEIILANAGGSTKYGICRRTIGPG
jgi:hypothetical protein